MRCTAARRQGEPMNQPTTPTIHEVFPYLMVRDAKAAIAFYGEVFGATELFRLVEPSGRIGHAELQLGPIVLMLSEEYHEYGMLSPQGDTGNGFVVHQIGRASCRE